MFTITTILVFVLLIFFFVSERVLRQGQVARRLDRGRFDRGSTGLVGVFSLLTLLALLIGLFLPQMPSLALRWLGVALMVGGIGLRAWANRTLGRFYTRTLLIAEHHEVVQSGPYRVVRHPGYLGALLMWIGAALGIGSLIVVPMVILLGVVYAYRIGAEEAMLIAALGEAYERYRAHTRRLIPFIF